MDQKTGKNLSRDGEVRIVGSLKAKAMEGIIWAGGQAVASKAITFGSQLVLAWLLVPEDFGLVAMCNSMILLLGVFQSGGVRAVLVRRHASIHLWSEPAFWLAASVGICALLLVLLSAPILVSYYNEPRLSAILPLMALGMFIDALAVVPTARLQAGLKFKQLGRINVLTPIGINLLAVLLAWAEFRTYSLVIPKIPIGFCVLALLWRESGLKLSFRMQTRRWKYLVTDSIFQLGAALAFAAANQVYFVAIARHLNPTAVGLYAFAVMYTMQMITLFTVQLDSVLFPTLAKLDKTPQRQWNAFLRATSVLGLVVFAASGLQFVTAKPLVELLVSDRWEMAIPLIQCLTIGGALLATAIPTGSALQAKGLFKVYFLFAVGSLALAISMAFTAITFSANLLVGLVIAATLYQCSISIVGWLIVIRVQHGSIRELIAALGWPLIASCSATLLTQIVASEIQLPREKLLFLAITLYVTVWAGVLTIFWRTSLYSIFEDIRHALSALKKTHR